MAAKRRAGVGTAGFRKLALSMPGAIEGEHMQHPDFRANGRIFATIQPGGELGMVKVTPAEQRRLLAEHPDAFSTSSGAWGRAGCTSVRLHAVDPEVLRQAMTVAWEVVMAQGAAKPRKRKTR
jgi:hypothetical protein